MRDTARLGRSQGLRSVMVSNGYMLRQPLLELTGVLGAGRVDYSAGVSSGKNATGVKFNGVSGTGFEASSETLIKVTAPSGVTTGPLTVLSPMGNYTTLANFYVQPSITNVSPASGRAGIARSLAGAGKVFCLRG